MEFLQANWLWILLGLGAVWFLFRRGGMGCGMGGHGSHGSTTSKDAEKYGSARASHNGHGSDEPEDREAKTATRRSHRGC